MPGKAPVLGGGNVSLDDRAFGAPFRMALVHETVRAEMNARRRGTAATRTRGQVRGGGAKPWRQKGTGRARAGSNRSPIWVGGGTVFGPSPRSYTVKVNRKARRSALQSALSQHASLGSLAVFDAGAFDEPSTSQAADLLSDWGASAPTLILLTDDEAAAGKSFRNVARVSAMPVGDAGVADVIGAASLLVSQAALPALVARAVERAREETEEAEAPAAKPAARRRTRARAAAPKADAAAAPEAEAAAPSDPDADANPDEEGAE